MTIIEQTLVPKSPTTKSEDGIVVTNDFIAVIDGSTSKTDRRHSRRMSNGRYAMTLVADHIRQMPADTSCHQFCKGVTATIRKHYLPFWKTDKETVIERLRQHPEERLCASAAIYSRRRREVWLVGDCQCLIGGQYYDNSKPYEQQLAEQRAKKIQELLASGMTATLVAQENISGADRSQDFTSTAIMTDGQKVSQTFTAKQSAEEALELLVAEQVMGGVPTRAEPVVVYPKVGNGSP
jgi:glycerophosphoryl diester phosphodiesterase